MDTNQHFTQQTSAPEIKMSGTKGPLQSTAQKEMDTCVFQTETSQGY